MKFSINKFIFLITFPKYILIFEKKDKIKKDFLFRIFFQKIKNILKKFRDTIIIYINEK